MALDGVLLHTICGHLQPLVQGRISKIQNLSDEEFLFHIHTRSQGTQRLIINVHSNTNRIYLHSGALEGLPDPGRFVMTLRKYLSQAYIRSVDQIGFDRLLHFEIWSHNEFGDRVSLHLYAELMGKYANLVLTSEDQEIIDAAKRIPVYENSRRLIHPGATYTLPEQSGKMNPLEADTLDPDRSLVQQIQGFSPLLSREFLYRMKNGESYAAILQEVLSSDTLYIYDEKNFHALELKHLEREARTTDLMRGLEGLYASGEKKQRLDNGAKDVLQAVHSNLKRLEKKLPRLQEALEASQDYDQYREYGDLLFAYGSSLKKQPEIVLQSFETGEDVRIPIDMRFDIPGNANRYYKKYHKLKRSIAVLEEQIRQCRQETDYFRQIQEQLAHCDLQDAAEIRQELVRGRYMFERKNSRPARRKKVPHVLHLQLEDADIYIGKNNLQNQYVTHQLGRKNDLWFHVKDYHGSHVLLKTEEPSEELIRMAAMLACRFSGGAMSSSVPVDYTRISQLKKVPGAQPGFVTMKSYKTIYIDPDPAQVQEWIRQYQKKN